MLNGVLWSAALVCALLALVAALVLGPGQRSEAPAPPPLATPRHPTDWLCHPATDPPGEGVEVLVEIDPDRVPPEDDDDEGPTLVLERPGLGAGDRP